jgi:hypothetical protein
MIRLEKPTALNYSWSCDCNTGCGDMRLNRDIRIRMASQASKRDGIEWSEWLAS